MTTNPRNNQRASIRNGQIMAIYDRLESSHEGALTATLLASLGRRDALMGYLDAMHRAETTRSYSMVLLAA